MSADREAQAKVVMAMIAGAVAIVIALIICAAIVINESGC